MMTKINTNMNKYKRRFIKISTVLFAMIFSVSLISSCGFHLRGQGPSMSVASVKNSRVYLVANQDNGGFYRQLRRDLQFSQVTLIDDPLNAEWHIVILSSKMEKSSIGIDQNGRTNEYQLTTTIEYLLDSTNHFKPLAESSEKIENRKLTTSRRFYFDNNDVIGKRNEEKTLLAAMNQELSARLIRVFATRMYH